MVRYLSLYDGQGVRTSVGVKQRSEGLQLLDSYLVSEEDDYIVVKYQRGERIAKEIMSWCQEAPLSIVMGIGSRPRYAAPPLSVARPANNTKQLFTLTTFIFNFFIYPQRRTSQGKACPRNDGRRRRQCQAQHPAQALARSSPEG